MFKISESPEFTHKVVVPVPVDGGFKDETLMARFGSSRRSAWPRSPT